MQTLTCFVILSFQLLSGLDGSFRGCIYRRNADLREGWLAIVQGSLLFRPKEFDNEPLSMCYILDTMSLQVRYISQ